ncbi:MAG: phosphohexomutase domain-containing protein, partial [Planctomycetota bacterium]
MSTSIFKACDVRGLYPGELDEATAQAIGRALGAEVLAACPPGRGADCILAGDLRPSTPALKEAARRGLLDAGVEVKDLGEVPTPVAYWAKRSVDASGLLMVTASHNPPEYNGFKLMIGRMPVRRAQMEAVRGRVEAGDFGPGPRGTLRRLEVKGDYLAWLGARFAETGDGLKVLLDAGNGSASRWAPAAFRAAGYAVEELFCEPDGRFPNRSPNPSRPEAVEAASERTPAAGADFAVCFDGDADRAVFLDE